MKITAIESIQIPELPRLMLVQVHTDSGIVGIGETVDKIPGSKGALHGTLAPLLLGQNPMDIEGLWQFMMDNIMYHGYAGAEVRALSAVEIALWDIVGKHYNIPLYQLLGGKVRDAVPTYNTCIGYGDYQDYQQWHEDAGVLAQSLLDDGVHAMKIWSFDRFSERSMGQYIRQADIAAGLKPIQQIRDAVGDAMEIGIECHFRWNRASIERIARALEPYNILFLEDVMPAVFPDEIKRISERISIPIVGSELLLTRWQMRDWLQKGVSQIAMTDPVWNGGIAETRRIANLAEAYGTPLVLHNVAGPICHAVSLHIGAHIPNLFFMESVRAFYRGYFDVIGDYTPLPADGHFSLAHLSQKPGIGVILNPELLARDDLIRETSSGDGKAIGKRAMGDHWSVEDIR
ncbi:MAG: mandelate racemase/muconate lactonizing enzyme family protein [Aggregatilineales bacterium]